jgi:hypothetical protein
MPADVTNNARVKRWRKNNRARYNAYMRQFMREWRRKKRNEQEASLKAEDMPDGHTGRSGEG